MSDIFESTSAADGGADPGPTLPDTPTPDSGSTLAPEGGASPSKEDTFFDPSQLTPELQTQWKRMQGAYTKKMQGAAEWRKKADAFDRFYGDPTYQQQVLEQSARQLGYTLNRQGQMVPTGHGSTPSASPELLGALKESLGPELGFLADKLAPSLSAFLEQRLQATVGPLAQRTEQMTQASKQAKRTEAFAELSEKAPGWEAYQDDMDDLEQFLQSEETHSKRWGNKAALLYRMANNGAAVQDAQQRMKRAAQNRTVTGQVGRTHETNWDEAIKKEANPSKRFALYGKRAEAELQKLGLPIPE